MGLSRSFALPVGRGSRRAVTLSVFHPWPQSLSGVIRYEAFPLLVAAEVTRRILLSDPPIPESSLLRKLNRSKRRQQRFDSLSPFPPFAPVKCVSLASAATAKGVRYRGWTLKSRASSGLRAIRRDAEWMRPRRSRSPNRKPLSSCGRTHALYRVGHGPEPESGARLPYASPSSKFPMQPGADD